MDATIPTVVSATYDKWCITSFAAVGDGCVGLNDSALQPVALTIQMQKYRVRPDGLSERSPSPTDTRLLTIGDLYASLGANPTDPVWQQIGAAMASLTAAVAAYAAARGEL